MSFSGKIFVLIFVLIACVSFVGFASYIQMHNGAKDVSISNTSTAYYDINSVANQSINQTIGYAYATTSTNTWLPMFIAICFVLSAIFIFVLVVKKR